LPPRHYRTNRKATLTIYQKLESLGITLTPLTPPAAAFVPFVRTGNLLFISGHIAKRDGAPWKGKLGAELATSDGESAARAIAADLINTLHAAAGDLALITRIVKLMVLVNSAPDFTEQHLVANGASRLFAEVFGEIGQHARSAFGTAQIPFGSCVEIELIAEVKET
jgi:enamine deaminase RidA (YjgF/YER057c/UK114 family)